MQSWDILTDLLAEMQGKPATAQAALVEKFCGSDAALRAEIEALLGLLLQADDFFESLEAQLQSLFWGVEVPPVSRAGEQLGPFVLEEEIGRGGMGYVYRACRNDGLYAQTVAIKILKKELESEEMHRRFREERQILASLRHPHICQLYDGGLTAQREPYLVMEYLPGQPITEYARNQPLNERLHLFLQAVQAVGYAHQNQVIHRDLKPSNLWVSPEGKLKLLDFGIATPIQPDPNRPLTQMRFLTPDYAAPEQLRQQRETTATDIYQLGLVLFELLTEHSAFDLKGKAFSEKEALILHTEPISPRKYLPHLSRDLVAIVQQCLQKEPEKRYASTQLLEADLQNYRQNRPVLARSPHWTYQWGKYLRRNVRAAVLLGIFALVLLLTNFAYIRSLIQARRQVEAEFQRAEAEYKRAEAARKETKEEASNAKSSLDFILAAVSEKSTSAAQQRKVKSLLPVAEQLLMAQSYPVEKESLFLELIAGIYQLNGDYPQAYRVWQKKLRGWQKARPTDSLALQTTYLQLSQYFIEAGQPDSAQAYLARILNKSLARGAEWEEIYFEALPLQSQLSTKGNAYEKQLLQALQAYPQSPHRHKLWFYLAQHYYQEQQFAAAQKAFQTFLQLAPATEVSLTREAQLRLVQSYLAQNQIVLAGQLLEEIRLAQQSTQKSSSEKLILKIKRLSEVIYPAFK